MIQTMSKPRIKSKQLPLYEATSKISNREKKKIELLECKKIRLEKLAKIY